MTDQPGAIDPSTLQGQFVVTYDLERDGANYTHYQDFNALVAGEQDRRRIRPELNVVRVDRTPPDGGTPDVLDLAVLDQFIEDADDAADLRAAIAGDDGERLDFTEVSRDLGNE